MNFANIRDNKEKSVIMGLGRWKNRKTWPISLWKTGEYLNLLGIPGSWVRAPKVKRIVFICYVLNIFNDFFALFNEHYLNDILRSPLGQIAPGLG